MRKNLSLPAVAIAFVLVCAYASAYADAPLSAEYTGCMQRAKDNIVQQSICVHQELAKQDARLNKAYGELNRQLGKNSEQRAAL